MTPAERQRLYYQGKLITQDLTPEQQEERRKRIKQYRKQWYNKHMQDPDWKESAAERSRKFREQNRDDNREYMKIYMREYRKKQAEKRRLEKQQQALPNNE